MCAHAAACLPEEACGILVGQGSRAEKVIPVTNELHSPVRFRMAPLEQLDALIWLEDRGLDLLAIFHSHPTGPAMPSETDIAEFYYPGSAVIILSPADPVWQLRAFRIESGRVSEIPIHLNHEDTKG